MTMTCHSGQYTQYTLQSPTQYSTHATIEVPSRQCSGLKATTYHNHLGWLQNETFIGPTGTASCPLPEAETKETRNSLTKYKQRSVGG